METEYTKNGMKITHPSGVTQLLSVENLQKIKNTDTEMLVSITNDITRIDANINKLRKIVNALYTA